MLCSTAAEVKSSQRELIFLPFFLFPSVCGFLTHPHVIQLNISIEVLAVIVT